MDVALDPSKGTVAGVLILCGTPLGNLGDAPPRLAEALEQADCVYAEDTRRSGKLLAALGVNAPRLRSYFAGNEKGRADELAARLRSGETVALMTDAGTPGISDPGLTAVRAAQATQARVTIIPGPSAVTSALAVSGMAAHRFAFEGFLPRSGPKRVRSISRAAASGQTVVLFCSPHNLRDDLSDLATAGMADRPLCVVRELTKLHEEIWVGTVAQAREEWDRRAPQGEFTLVIGVGVAADQTQPPETERMARAGEGVARLRTEGLSTATAVREVARLVGVPRSDLYRWVHR